MNGVQAVLDESEASPLAIATTPRTVENAPDRQAALPLIREARQWFEQHEPSSPIPVLLRRAEQFVGERYIDVTRAEWE
jgi:type VI secretion system protein ImpA